MRAALCYLRTAYLAGEAAASDSWGQRGRYHAAVALAREGLAGDARRYGELAQQLGSGPRASGGACRANPVPLVVPCHRVVAVGTAGGFMGHVDGPALALKRWLLQHEQGRS